MPLWAPGLSVPVVVCMVPPWAVAASPVSIASTWGELVLSMPEKEGIFVIGICSWYICNCFFNFSLKGLVEAVYFFCG